MTGLKRLRILLVLKQILLIVSIASVAHGREVTIKVLPDNSVDSTSFGCRQSGDFDCSDSLSNVVLILNSSEWQKRLTGQVSRVRVVISEGVYRLTKPIKLSWGTGSTKGITLDLIGQGRWGDSKQTVLTGARPIIPKADSAENKSPLIFNLFDWPAFEMPPPRGFGQPINPVMTELFQGDLVFQVATWPNNGYGRVLRHVDMAESDRTNFAVEGRDSQDWKNEPDLRVFAYWFYDWAAQTYAASVLLDGRLVLTGSGAQYGIKNGQRLRIENALSELDAPGEWYLDRSNKRLHVLPLVGADPSIPYELSMARGLLEIDNSRDLTVRNIAFEKSRGDAIRIRNSDEIVFDRVSIRHTGNRAMLVEGGSKCGVHDALIEHNGEGAITLSGGDRTTLQPSGHYVDNSTIRDFSRLSKTYRFAVEINGVGQRVVGNVISDAPHTAILFTGNDHRIADNEIFNVVQETGDAGAIYVGRDFTARGTVIENNYMHDIHTNAAEREVKGVYLDDQASGIAVRNNIFAYVQQPVFIGGGRDNLIEGNVFYNSSPAIFLDARGMNWQRAATLDPKLELQTRLNDVPYSKPPYAYQYPNLARIREDEFGAPKYNLARHNVVVKGEPFRVTQDAISGIDLGGIAAQGEEVFAKPVPLGGRVRREDFVLKRSSTQSKTLHINDLPEH